MTTFERFLTVVSRQAGIKLNVTAISRDPFIKYQYAAAEESGLRGRVAKEIIKERVVDYTLFRDEVGYFYPPVYEGKMPIKNTGYCQGAVCYVTIFPGTSGLTMDNPAFYIQPITAKYAFVPSQYSQNPAALRARLNDTYDIQDDVILQKLQQFETEYPDIYHKIVIFAKTFKAGYDPSSYDPIEIEAYKDVVDVENKH